MRTPRRRWWLCGKSIVTPLAFELTFSIDDRLVPNSTLIFAYEGSSKSLQEFIKEELLMLVQAL
jgi:hypothetical protein